MTLAELTELNRNCFGLISQLTGECHHCLQPLPLRFEIGENGRGCVALPFPEGVKPLTGCES